MRPIVAILGRPNVGKSTLFNRLAGKKLALVEDTPGVTRDWREAPARLGHLEFSVIDTAGLEGFEDPLLKDQILEQNRRVVDRADVILFVIDGREGVLSSDEVLAGKLRGITKPIILLVNKAESRSTAGAGILESHKLGLGDPVAISAAHGEGLAELFERLEAHIGPLQPQKEPDEDQVSSGEDTPQGGPSKPPRPLNLVILGQPNVGKSTLINQMIGEQRLLTGDRPGVTRDAVTVDWTYEGRPIRLHDTAGVRKRGKVNEWVEQLSVADSLKAMRFAEVVVLLLDARQPLTKQDLHLASRVVEEGRCLILALNKWDLVAPKVLNEVKARLERELPQVSGIPVVPLVALTGRHVDRLMKAVTELYDLWNVRLSTGQLNKWLAYAIERHPPPMVGRNRLRVKYATQIKTRPPTIALFVSKAAEAPESYIRYLVNSLRESFELPGVPIRIYLRQSKNPYVGQK
ncbi:MAG: ribosome biogenesis GTPase Der [Holosporales bacterium]